MSFVPCYERSFQQLRHIAACLLRHERRDISIQPTSLVAEAFLKVRGKLDQVQNEAHFFGINTLAMKQALIDAGRTRQTRAKYLPAYIRFVLSKGNNKRSAEDAAAITQAFAALLKKDPIVGETLRLHFHLGHNQSAIAAMQGRDRREVHNDISFGLSEIARALNLRLKP
jgi:DNA-directed RNA polymerase specialized sigma24 family protein